jgi:hypothetical protein
MCGRGAATGVETAGVCCFLPVAAHLSRFQIGLLPKLPATLFS